MQLRNKFDIFQFNQNATIIRFENCILIDNFYKYPNKVREFALKQQYKSHNALYKTMYFDPKFSWQSHKNFLHHLEKIESKIINKDTWNTNIKTDSNGYFQYFK